MKININYGNQVAVLPGAALKYFDCASKADMNVLFCVAIDSKLDSEKIAKMLSMRSQEVETSLAFWEEKGIISVSKSKNLSKVNVNDSENYNIENDLTSDESEPKKRVVLRRSEDIPKYTSEELSNLLEERQGAAELVHECQNVLGKIFNVREIEITIGLVDYLGLTENFVIALMKYCSKLGKKSLSYVEKTAIALIDEGIDTEDALKQREADLEEFKSMEGNIRRLFGIKSRAFTGREKKSIENWIFNYKYDIEIINNAYEKTIAATNEPSIPYANAIIESWFAEGVKTLEDIEKLDAKKSKDNLKKSKGNQKEGSFDTDDFFEAALKKSSESN